MFEEIVPLYPVHFVNIALDCHYFDGKAGDFLASRYQLPDFASFYNTSSFAKVALGWSEKGIFVTVETSQAFRESFFPDFRKGDSVEIFIDTRDVKTSGFNTRFCHHFFFLPEEVERDAGRNLSLSREGQGQDKKNVEKSLTIEESPLGQGGLLQNNGDRVRAGEITRFRGEERHPLADPSTLVVSTEKKWRGVRMSIFIPADSLFGFAPNECERCGFTYRINQAGGSPQFFSATDMDFPIEIQPSLWASVKLLKEGKNAI